MHQIVVADRSDFLRSFRMALDGRSQRPSVIPVSSVDICGVTPDQVLFVDLDDARSILDVRGRRADVPAIGFSFRSPMEVRITPPDGLAGQIHVARKPARLKTVKELRHAGSVSIVIDKDRELNLLQCARELLAQARSGEVAGREGRRAMTLLHREVSRALWTVMKDQGPARALSVEQLVSFLPKWIVEATFAEFDHKTYQDARCDVAAVLSSAIRGLKRLLEETTWTEEDLLPVEWVGRVAGPAEGIPPLIRELPRLEQRLERIAAVSGRDEIGEVARGVQRVRRDLTAAHEQLSQLIRDGERPRRRTLDRLERALEDVYGQWVQLRN